MAFARATVIGFVAVAVLLILVGCVGPLAGETAPTATSTASETPTPIQTSTPTETPTITFSPTPTLPGGVTVEEGPALISIAPLAGAELVTSLSELPEGEYVIVESEICPPEKPLSCPMGVPFPVEIRAYATDDLEGYLLAKVPDTGYAWKVAGDKLFVLYPELKWNRLTILDLWSGDRVEYQAYKDESYHQVFPSGEKILLYGSLENIIFLLDDQRVLITTNDAGIASIAPDESWVFLEYCKEDCVNDRRKLILMLESGKILREPIPYEPDTETPQGQPPPPVGLLGEYDANISPDGAWLAEYGYEGEANEVYITPVSCLFQHPLDFGQACLPERLTIASFPGPSYRCGAYFISWAPDAKSLLFDVTTYHEGFTCPSQGFYQVGIDGLVTRLLRVPGSLSHDPARGLEGWLPLSEKMLWRSVVTDEWGLYWLDYGGQAVNWGDAPGIPIGAVVVP